jgi:hypothetical protein
MANTLAYYDTATITAVKGFIKRICCQLAAKIGSDFSSSFCVICFVLLLKLILSSVLKLPSLPKIIF